MINGRALSLSFVAAMLTGCGSNAVSPPAPPQPGPLASPAAIKPSGPKPHGWLSPEAENGQPLIYVADGDEVLIYSERRDNSEPIGSITDGVSGSWGLFVDRHRNLYVANRGANTVTVYPPGALSPSFTYSSSLQGPMYPIVNHAGNVFVSNSGGGAVVEFPHNNTTPRIVLHTPGSESDGMAFDPFGNLYVAYRNGGGGIVEFTPGSTQEHVLPIRLDQPQGLAITSAGQMLAVVTGRDAGLYVFPTGIPSRGSVFSVPVKVRAQATLTQLVLTEAEHRLFLSSYGPIYVTPFPLVNHNGRAYHLLYAKIRFDHKHHMFGVQGMALSNGQSF